MSTCCFHKDQNLILYFCLIPAVDASLTASVMVFGAEFWTFIMLIAAKPRNKDSTRLKEHERLDPCAMASRNAPRLPFTDLFPLGQSLPKVLVKTSQLPPFLEDCPGEMEIPSSSSVSYCPRPPT